MLSGAFFTLEINRMEVLFIMKKLQLDYELNKQVKKKKYYGTRFHTFKRDMDIVTKQIMISHVC
jgi:hypothetical protein